MVCLACALPGYPLCKACVYSLQRTPPEDLGGIPVEAGFAHVGAAVRLVHNLKYRRSLAAGRMLAAGMLAGVPSNAAGFVPMPRSTVRRIIYGVDQAMVLARALRALTGLPVVDALSAPVWWRRQAGAQRQDRHPVAFKSLSRIGDGMVLVDDVLTTGATARSAIEALDGRGLSLLVATRAGTMEPGTSSFPSLGGGVTRMDELTSSRPEAAQPRTQTGSPRVGPMTLSRPLVPTDGEEHG